MKKKDIFIGRQPALEILKSDTAVEKILIQKEHRGEIDEIKAICKEQRISLRTVPKEK
ncbi:MAG: RNA methyltransferase substrate-binding domain-containing protein [Chitinophagales bacterium]